MSTAKRLAPELENGAVMTREEFHEAYADCEGLRRAELVEGVVFMPSPVRYESHDKPAALIRGWLFSYSLKHPETETGGEASLLLGQSEVQPDAFLMRTGSVPSDEDGYLTGAPQLVVEIAASSKSRDLHSKMDIYRRHGVAEYIVWRTVEGAIDWFRSVDGQFQRVQPDKVGVIESAIFPGLRLSIPRALAMDSPGLVELLR
ncbi:MAG: Uma2 family endonuclease [Dehalococcoidia bacterium]